jgi:hypothetical protein
VSARKLVLVNVALLGALVLFGVAWLCWPRTAITRENTDQIQPGMTQAEVHAILGGPPRDESSGPLDLDEPDEGIADLIRQARLRQWVDCAVRSAFDPEGGKRSAWQSNQVAVYVWWDAHGNVTSVDCFPMRLAPESPLARLRRWLRL